MKRRNFLKMVMGSTIASLCPLGGLLAGEKDAKATMPWDFPHCVNKGKFWGEPEGTWFCTGFQIHRTNRTIEYTIEHSPDGWNPKVFNGDKFIYMNVYLKVYFQDMVYDAPKGYAIHLLHIIENQQYRTCVKGRWWDHQRIFTADKQ